VGLGETWDTELLRQAWAAVGYEAPRMYVSYTGPAVERPVRQLRGFQRITLQPNETRTVEMRLKAADLSYWDTAKHAFAVEPGKIEVQPGASSSDIRLSKTLRTK
jgi:beta-glucosidase